MVVIDSIDGANRRVYLHADTVGSNLHPIDIYKEMRTLRSSDETLRQFDLFMEAAGNESKGGGKFTERFVKLLNGTMIVPYDTTQVLTITGTLINDAGQEGVDLFDRTPLSVTSVVDINYVPPQVEVITVATGGALTPAQETSLSNIETVVTILRKIDLNRMKIDNTTNTLTIYDDDGTTPMNVFDLTDSAGNPTSESVYERTPQ